MSARILGMDYGDARIGIAVSDPLGRIARGLVTVSRKNPVDLSESLKAIADIVDEYQIKTIVLGYPKNMDNSEGLLCEKVKTFKAKLERALPEIFVDLYDERLTTARAGQIFNEVGLAKSKRKQNVDKMAAVIILQDYLDLSNKNNMANNFKEKSMEFDENVNENFDLDGEEIELETIVMTDEDGNEVEYVVIDEFTHEETSYLIMIKAEHAEADDDEAEAAIFKQVEALEDEFVYEEIDEDEYNKLEDVLKARLAEFDIDIQ